MPLGYPRRSHNERHVTPDDEVARLGECLEERWLRSFDYPVVSVDVLSDDLFTERAGRGADLTNRVTLKEPTPKVIQVEMGRTEPVRECGCKVRLARSWSADDVDAHPRPTYRGVNGG